MSDVNYRLSKADTGGDAGVFHVMNLQPFHTWDTASPNKRAGHGCPDQSGSSCSETDPDRNLFAQNSSCETVEMTCDAESHDSPLTDLVHAPADHYNLRPRQVPRVTSRWADSRWTSA